MECLFRSATDDAEVLQKCKKTKKQTQKPKTVQIKGVITLHDGRQFRVLMNKLSSCCGCETMDKLQ